MTDSTLNNPNKNNQESLEDKDPLLYQRGQTVEGMVLSISGNNKATVLRVGEYIAKLDNYRITWDSDDPDPKDYLYVGQKLNVKILRVNHNKKKMVVGLRDLLEKAPISPSVIPGTITDGTVLRKVNSGFILSLKDGGEGFLHKYELTWYYNQASKKARELKIGDTLHVLVLDNNPEKNCALLSLKRLQENPFDLFEKEHPVGSSFEVVVLEYFKQSFLVHHPIIGTFKVHYSPSWMISFDNLKEHYPKYSKLNMRVRPGNNNLRFTFEPSDVIL